MSSKRNVLVTGFPGFLATALVERLVARHAGAARVTCLVPRAERAVAEERAALIRERCEAPEDALVLVDGDITRYDLDCGPDERSERTTTEVFHLEQARPPRASAEELERVNVTGTRHMLDLAARCPRLRRFHLLSTCFVSGRTPGLYSEERTDAEGGFHDPYEATRAQAEVELRQRAEEGLAATVYRPTRIVGDSRDGFAFRLDGPYRLVRAVLTARRRAAIAVPADPERHRLHLVPRDYVADAIDALASLGSSAGRTYHLCDSSPPTVARFLELVAAAAGKELALRRGLLGRVAGAGALEPADRHLLAHPAVYSSRYALRDLGAFRVKCPRVETWVERMVQFTAAHPELDA